MTSRDEVLREYHRPYQSHEDVGGPDAERMADEIATLRAELAAVREEARLANVGWVECAAAAADHAAEADALRHRAERMAAVVEALREPSEAVKAVADATYWDRSVVKDVWEDVFSKAVEEAEREVAHD